MKLKYSPVSHVIFDLDGLLLDTVPIYNGIMASIVQRQGYPYTAALRAKLRGRNRRDCAELIVRHCENCLSVEDCLEQLNRQHSRKLANCQLMPGAEKLIRHLHKHRLPMAIGTSSSVQSVAIKSKGHENLLGLVNHVVCGTDDPRVGRGKPAPDIFLVAAQNFGDPAPPPSQCLVFEDAQNGVDAARAAGMQVVFVSDPRENPAADETQGEIIVGRKRRVSMPGVHVIDSLVDFQPELFGLPPFEVD